MKYQLRRVSKKKIAALAYGFKLQLMTLIKETFGDLLKRILLRSAFGALVKKSNKEIS